MNKRISTLLFFGVMICICHYGYTQESVNAAGGDAMGMGGTASYTVGQLVNTSLGEDGTTVAQGV